MSIIVPILVTIAFQAADTNQTPILISLSMATMIDDITALPLATTDPSIPLIITVPNFGCALQYPGVYCCDHVGKKWTIFENVTCSKFSVLT